MTEIVRDARERLRAAKKRPPAVMATSRVNYSLVVGALLIGAAVWGCNALWGFDDLTAAADASNDEIERVADAAADADDGTMAVDGTPGGVCVSGSTCWNGCEQLTCGPSGRWAGACGGTCTMSFSYTGASQTFSVPDGVTRINVTATGGAGGRDCYGTRGGLGASVSAVLDVTPGDRLSIYVGGVGGMPQAVSGYCTIGGAGGFNGGGAGGASSAYGGGGGGGASDVRMGGTALANRVLVAAGGGGGGAGSGGGEGGAGGNPTGLAGSPGATSAGGGQPGTPTAGGGGGASIGGAATGGTGTAGAGGTGGNGSSGGGGGGGGYFGGGGGGGASATDVLNAGGGGGGGSSYVVPAAMNVTMNPGAQAGTGRVVLAY